MSSRATPAMTRTTAARESAPAAAPPVVQQSLRAPGVPLPAPVRNSFEQRFGHDLGNVRIHTDSQAAESARAVNARAFNVGSDIVFGGGQFAPHSGAGRQLLAHELTHVIQQRGRGPGESSTAAESQADAVAHQFESGAPIAIRAGTHAQALQRSPADDQEIEAILKSAPKVAKAKPPDASAAEPVRRLIKRYLPEWELRVSSVVFTDKVQRIEVKSASKATSLEISFSKAFVADMTDARSLRKLAIELESKFTATSVKPDVVDMDLSKTSTAAKAAKSHNKEGIKLTGTRTLQDIGATSYWFEKVQSRFVFVNVNNTKARLIADPEEADAVLSVLWDVQPAKVGSTSTKVVSIAARAPVGKVKPKDLLYRFGFLPPDKKVSPLPQVQVQFLGEDKAATVATGSAPATGFTAQNIGLKHLGFPKTDIKAYWAAHPEEKKQVFNFMQNTAPADFDQVLRVTTGTGKKQRIQDFKVSGKRDNNGDLQDVQIELLAAQVDQAAAPKTYRDKQEAGDFELEKHQAKTTDKLGKVDVPRDISASESSQIKFMVASYFKKGARNTEVDMRLAADRGEVLYTIRFLSGNDVEVVRVGEPKQGTVLDPARMDIGRSPEFLDLFRAKDVGKLSSYIGKRYKGVPVTGKTVGELRANLNASIVKDSGSVGWFKNNYQIDVLDSTAAEKRLENVHKLPAPQRVGLKNFSTSELRLVEQALESFSLKLLEKIRDTPMVRQDVNIIPDGKKFKQDKTTAGQVMPTPDGTSHTLQLFNQMSVNTATLFAGGSQGVLASETGTIAHEFGHIIEKSDDILAKFNAFVKKEKIAPITGYAETKPTTDFFTEAFALYQTDPEWLKAHQTKIYEWIDAVSKTGKPPP